MVSVFVLWPAGFHLVTDLSLYPQWNGFNLYSLAADDRRWRRNWKCDAATSPSHQRNRNKTTATTPKTTFLLLTFRLVNCSGCFINYHPCESRLRWVCLHLNWSDEEKVINSFKFVAAVGGAAKYLQAGVFVGAMVAWSHLALVFSTWSGRYSSTCHGGKASASLGTHKRIHLLKLMETPWKNNVKPWTIYQFTSWTLDVTPWNYSFAYALFPARLFTFT